VTPAASRPSLSIVIPAFNEEAGLPVALAAAREAFPAAEIIVVDDASRDGTAAVAAAVAGVRVNRGQGAALKTGMRAATGDWVAWFDADNEHRAADLARLVARAESERLVAVIGQRTGASASRLRGIGKALIRLVGRGLMVRAGGDLNCGLRLFRRAAIVRYLPLLPDRFSASLVTTLLMLERGYPIAFEPIDTNPRVGTSTVRLRDGFDAVLALIRAVLLFAPTRVFLPPAAVLIALGLVYSLVVAFAGGRGIPVGGVLVMGVGLLLGMLGLIADQISQMRLAQLPDASLALGEDPGTPPR
jgi:hypothetical protein